MRGIIAWAILCLLAFPARAQDVVPGPVLHVLLLDVSGSMRGHGYAERQADGTTRWLPPLPTLVGKLFGPDGQSFRPDDQIVVCPFSDPVTDQKEGRAPTGRKPLSQMAEVAASLPAPGGGATDIARALDMAADLYTDPAPAKSVLVWLITDNENNMSGNQSDQAFYQRLRDSPAYTNVLFFPLADPAARPTDNLVMYLLVPRLPGPESDRGWVDALAEEVKAKTGFEGIVFRPLYTDPGRPALQLSKQLELTQAGHKKRVQQEGGTTVLLFDEGEKLHGQLRFKVRSNLKGWKVVGATLNDASVELHVPAGYAGASGDHKLTWKMSSARTLQVGPEQDSADWFVLDLAQAGSRPLVLQRSWSELLANPLATYLPRITGKVTMSATLNLASGQDSGMQPSFSEEVRKRLAMVDHLPEITSFMVRQADLSTTEGDVRTIPFERSLVILVRANPLPGLLALGAFLAWLGSGGLLALALAVWKARYTLEGPQNSEELVIGYLHGSHLILAPTGQPLATLEQRWGGARLRPEEDVTVNGESGLHPIVWDTPEFRFELTPEGKPGHHYVLTRSQAGHAHGGGQEDGPSL